MLVETRFFPQNLGYTWIRRGAPAGSSLPISDIVSSCRRQTTPPHPPPTLAKKHSILTTMIYTKKLLLKNELLKSLKCYFVGLHVDNT